MQKPGLAGDAAFSVFGRGRAAWVLEAGLYGPQGVVTELLNFRRAWEGHLPNLESDRG